MQMIRIYNKKHKATRKVAKSPHLEAPFLALAALLCVSGGAALPQRLGQTGKKNGARRRRNKGNRKENSLRWA
ncbi:MULTISPECIES: hypothetical protein [unclassified Paraburkholderia]|uniref:hypothetical protein n=1 Tax=unclassified Paraburkholderia TaxID=2615204 RepID=UPI002AB67122|nr:MULTISPECIES: hypothetical protein [unclassified Paraburkholderia]